MAATPHLVLAGRHTKLAFHHLYSAIVTAKWLNPPKSQSTGVWRWRLYCLQVFLIFSFVVVDTVQLVYAIRAFNGFEQSQVLTFAYAIRVSANVTLPMGIVVGLLSVVKAPLLLTTTQLPRTRHVRLSILILSILTYSLVTLLSVFLAFIFGRSSNTCQERYQCKPYGIARVLQIPLLVLAVVHAVVFSVLLIWRPGREDQVGGAYARRRVGEDGIPLLRRDSNARPFVGERPSMGERSVTG